MKHQRYELTREKYLNDEEVTLLQRSIVLLSQKSPRDAVLIDLALHTGARAQELLAITPQDLYPEDGAIFIRGIKGSDNRYIPVPKPLFDRLKLLTPSLSPTKRIFPISYSRLRQIWCDVRPVKKKFHSLRHTFAVLAYRHTLNQRLVQLALGHRSAVNTEIYVTYHYKMQDFRKGLLGAIPSVSGSQASKS